MKNQKGFSLIELLLVVVIIGIIAAIAIPNLLASRRAANQSSAISSLRTYHQAQMTYQTTIGGGQFANATFAGSNALPTLASANLIDSVLASGSKSGYTFWCWSSFTSTGIGQFGGRATPTVTSGITQTGILQFLMLTEGVIYSDAVGGSMTVNIISGNSIVIANGTPLNN